MAFPPGRASPGGVLVPLRVHGAGDRQGLIPAPSRDGVGQALIPTV